MRRGLARGSSGEGQDHSKGYLVSMETMSVAYAFWFTCLNIPHDRRSELTCKGHQFYRHNTQLFTSKYPLQMTAMMQ